MKRIACLTMAVYSIVMAQTTINTPTVSGTWTVAGSPYIIQNVITVTGAQVLTIEPGVVVNFQPETKLEVNGQLIADGTNSSPITFQAIDTTGWSNDMTTAGGWSGIHFHQYAGGGTDQSIMNHCIIKDAKYGYAFAVMYANAFTTERGLKIHNCTIRHNRTGTSGTVAEPPLFLRTYLTTDTIDVDNCVLTDNISVFGTIQNSNYGGGYTRIANCHIYQNSLGSGIYANLNDMLIENNEIDHNTMVNDAGPLRISGGNIMIRGNKIHHNQSDDYGGIACRSGKITIENNFVSNNRQNDEFCGITGGGAGINVAHNEGAIPFDSTYYIIRNNIVANNYSSYGGGGMYVYNARATIANNHIVNNYTPNQGKGIQVTHPNSEVYMVNNLFHTQSGPGNVETNNIVYILSANKIQFDNNFIPSSFHQSVNTAWAYTLVGDTLDNVTGTNPDFFNPTTDNDILTDATVADFHILATSPCIGEGDTTGCYPAITDYAGNPRIQGVIDIGAYEYTVGENVGIENVGNMPKDELKIYPNPANVSSSFTVDLPSPQGQLTIFDVNGKMVYDQPATSSTMRINLNNLKGIFFIQFKGPVNVCGKVIIQ